MLGMDWLAEEWGLKKGENDNKEKKIYIYLHKTHKYKLPNYPQLFSLMMLHSWVNDAYSVKIFMSF